MNEGTPDKNLKKEVQNLRIILYSMMAWIVIFSFVSLVVKGFIEPLFLVKQMSANLFVIFLFTVTAALAGLRYYFSKKIKITAASYATDKQKFEEYKKELMILFAGLEIIALFCVTAFLLTGHYYFLIIPAVVLLEMFFKLPTESKLNNYVFNTKYFNL